MLRNEDLANRRLVAITASTLTLAVLALAALPLLPDAWARPGSPLLQSAAILGSLLLLAGFWAAMGKRFGRRGKRGFGLHVMLSCTGLVLVTAHSTGSFLHFPALLLATLAALVVLGLWARLAGARRLAGRFARKPRAFAVPDAATRAQLRALIDRKTALLADLEPGADEAQFSLQPRHWRRRPGRALAYWRLADAEARLTGAGTLADRWRLVHQLLAWGFVLGLAIHVIISLFFAGWVAEGREVYWWHVTAWG